MPGSHYVFPMKNYAALLFPKQNKNVLTPNFYTHIFCERLRYFHDRSVYFAAAKYVDWEYINRSQTHEFRNWD
jgi:hypothetical protein